MPDEPIAVVVAGLEEAQDQVAELWVGGRLFATSVLQDGSVMLRIEPRGDGGAWEVGAAARPRGPVDLPQIADISCAQTARRQPRRASIGRATAPRRHR